MLTVPLVSPEQFQRDPAIGFHPQKQDDLIEIKFGIVNRRTPSCATPMQKKHPFDRCK